jgi:hypothetical protein
MENNNKRLIDMTQEELSRLLILTISSLIGDLKTNDQKSNNEENEEIVPRLTVAREFSVSAVTLLIPAILTTSFQFELTM